MSKLLDFFRKTFFPEPTKPDKSRFEQKYTSFKQLLAANNRALEVIANLEHIIFQKKPFTFRYALTQIESLFVEINIMIRDLSILSGGKYQELYNIGHAISERIFAELLRKIKIEETNLVLPIERLSMDVVTDVGGKAANLGEVYNRVNLPVPLGFVITSYAYDQFLEYNELEDLIKDKLKRVDINDTEYLMQTSREIQSRIVEAQLQPDLENTMRQAAAEQREKFDYDYRFAVRSSATSEDSAASFAGQHTTLLNISAENLGQAYKEVVASTFNPRAIYYRRRKGYHDLDVAMSVACIMMIDAKVSGVLYTVDPNDQHHDVVMISAVWGLAALAVEGAVSTDYYQIDKQSGSVEIVEVASKEMLLRCDQTDGVVEECVAEVMQNVRCLDAEQIGQLTDYASRLEKHYGHAMDIEWAFDQNNKLYILQARLLQQFRPSKQELAAEKSADGPPAISDDHPVILEGGVTACEGAAFGFAYVIDSDHLLHQIADGAIIVARQTSPRYVPLMGRIKAIITDVGTVTGHMASVAREFHIPTLVGTGSGTQTIRHGDPITVDATRKRIYQGKVVDLIKARETHNPMADSPIYHTVRSVLKKIAPLNLIDPKKENFTPQGCLTIHDIIRFVHETAMRQMFSLSDDLEPKLEVAIPLRAYISTSIYVVDLGNGLELKPGAKIAEIEDVRSIPFRALLKGIKHEGIDWHRDVGVSVRGLTAMVAESVLRDPMKEGRMGAPSYAIVAGHYLNFNSRMGYHYTTIDTYCSEEVNDNYITFYFKGGAADIARRSRRALLIVHILKHLGFKVEHKSDMVRGEMKKFQMHAIEKSLDMLGRLMGSVRLLDMVLSEDRQIDWYAEQFIKGNYQFDPDFQ